MIPRMKFDKLRDLPRLPVLDSLKKYPYAFHRKVVQYGLLPVFLLVLFLAGYE